MPHSTSNSSEKVLEFLCDRRFHRTFTYTSNTTSHRVSYSDYGSPSSSTVVLFFGGLMGGRMSYSPLDALAKKHHIRILHPDRPGVGGTDATSIENRKAMFLEIVPRLLQHLRIQHVSLAAHSFGTVYAMNVLLLYPQLLHPKRPYVAFFAPWVHPDHTGVRHLQAAAHLPAGVVGKFSNLARFVNSSVLPVVGMSSGLSNVVSGSLKSSTPIPDVTAVPPLQPSTEAEQRSRQSENSMEETCSLDLSNTTVVKELRTLIPTFFFAENVDGAGQDARLCLRKPRSIPWSTPHRPWEDIDDAVRSLISIIAEQAEPERIWAIDGFHAETDVMVGEKGRVWFDECWQGARSCASGEDRIAFRSQTVEGADHDFILDPAFGASEKWLERVAASSAEHTTTE